MRQIIAGLDWSVLTEIAMSVIPALICITVHELCHGLAAYALGDSTAKDRGRLTLNPIRHLDPLGLIMMAVAGFGWAKPVPVDPRNFSNPKLGMAVTALAGPLSNVVLAALVAVIYLAAQRFGLLNPYGFAAGTLANTIVLSCGLAVFNLIPIPPLDGSKVLFGVLLPDDIYMKLMRYERYGMLLLIILMRSGVTSSRLISASGMLIDFVMTPAIHIVSLLERFV